MEGPAALHPENPDNNANDNDNNENNTPAGPPNTSPQQPPNQPPPNQPAPKQPPPQQPVPQQPPPQQPAPANPTGWLQPFLHQPVPQIIHQQMVSWSHFKPELPGKPEEDAKAHFLCTNDWMRTHNFNEEDKVQRFCLPLLGEAEVMV